jgi:hypothetical protein
MKFDGGGCWLSPLSIHIKKKIFSLLGLTFVLVNETNLLVNITKKGD